MKISAGQQWHGMATRASLGAGSVADARANKAEKRLIEAQARWLCDDAAARNEDGVTRKQS